MGRFSTEIGKLFLINSGWMRPCFIIYYIGVQSVSLITR